MTEQELIERLREYGDEPQDVSMGEWAEWSHKSADMIEALSQQLNEAKNQLDSETFTRERREARCRELHAQLEKAREVKPLVWEDYPALDGPVLSMAVTDFGTYFICDDNDDFSGLYCELITHREATWYGTVKPKTHVIIARVHEDDPASLKQQAQADYQRRYNAMSQEGE